ncbi:MAG: hypothetical protein EOO16_10265 [Chitinophagaceae bacterium]|nr:MAG: hypothetical protein EOO16_10265 [Chitinophagaceae bacterium]
MASPVPSEHCLQAWLHCEVLLGQVNSGAHSFSLRTRRVLNECSELCLGTHEALRAGLGSTGEFALLCVGICVECAEVCARYSGSSFRYCADACMACAEALAAIADV